MPHPRSSARRRPRLAAGALLAAFATVASFPGCDAEAPTRPRRVILVSMDTVRASSVSGYGDGNPTPHLRDIAEEGSLFRDFYAASSYTIPATMSLFTGLDAAEHGMVTDKARLSPEVPTLAGLLEREGYRTAAFHEGVFVEKRFGFDRGFEQYLRRGRVEVVRRALPEVIEWMEEQGDDPYFLFVHTYAAHFPYGGIERYRRRHPERGLLSEEEVAALRAEFPFNRPGRKAARKRLSPERRALCTVHNQLADGRGELLGCGGYRPNADFPESPHFDADVAAIRLSYASRVALIDDALGRIRDSLAARDQWDDTLLIVTSDHGEAFYEHGLYQHGFVPFDEVLKVPLVISYPRLLREDGVRVVEGKAWHLDILPTVAGLVGFAPPRGLRGRDLSPALLGRERLPPDRTIYPAVLLPVHLGEKPLRRAALRRNWKYIEGDPAFGAEDDQLFDLARDPGEARNVADAEPDALRSLERQARSYGASLRRRPPVHQRTGEPLAPEDAGPVLSEEERAALQALGYAE